MHIIIDYVHYYGYACFLEISAQRHSKLIHAEETAFVHYLKVHVALLVRRAGSVEGRFPQADDWKTQRHIFQMQNIEISPR